MHYQRLLDTRCWREIPGCPGRVVLDGADEELDEWVRKLGTRFSVPAAEDEVLIWLLPGGGGAVLSHAKPDGRLVHTLNTAEGLRRKCEQLGIDLDGWIRRRNEGVHVDGPWQVVLTETGPDRRWALRLVRRHHPFVPPAESVGMLNALPLRFPEMSRDEAVALLREIEAHGGRATLE